MDINDELLNVGSHIPDDKLQEIYNEILQENTRKAGGDEMEKFSKLQDRVLPTPGCCLKTNNVKTNEKVFLNVCTSSNVPVPPDITEEELKNMVESLEDENAVVDYRIPMSIGEPHAELDKQNKGCVAYDIIINPNYLHKIQGSNVFLGFFTSVVLEGIDTKYGIKLDRNWTLLKRKKFVGSLRGQYMRTKKLIQEVPGGMSPASVQMQSVEKPKFRILREPEIGRPQFLIAEIELPKANRAKSVSVDVGEDRLVVSVKPHLYALDIFLPYKLVQEDSGSQFNVKTKILTVTMPVHESQL